MNITSIKDYLSKVLSSIDRINARVSKLSAQQRNIIGIVVWSVLAFVFGIVVLPFMVAREIYQYVVYLRPNGHSIEWNDIVTYSLLIAIFSLFHWCVFDLVFSSLPSWTWL